jgi:hypothetical protein
MTFLRHAEDGCSERSGVSAGNRGNTAGERAG